MKTHRISVSNRRQTVEQVAPIVAGTYGQDEVELDLDDEWGAMDTVSVLFSGSGRTLPVAVDGGKAPVPWECIVSPGKLRATVVGYVGTESRLTTAVGEAFNVDLGDATACGCRGLREPTPTLDMWLAATVRELTDAEAVRQATFESSQGAREEDYGRLAAAWDASVSASVAEAAAASAAAEAAREKSEEATESANDAAEKATSAAASSDDAAAAANSAAGKALDAANTASSSGSSAAEAASDALSAAASAKSAGERANLAAESAASAASTADEAASAAAGAASDASSAASSATSAAALAEDAASKAQAAGDAAASAAEKANAAADGAQKAVSDEVAVQVPAAVSGELSKYIMFSLSDVDGGLDAHVSE